MRMKADLKATVLANRGQPGQIVADKLSLYNTEVRVAAGSVESLKRTVRRAKKGTSPKEPDNINTIPIPLPDDYSFRDGESFLIYDNNSQQSRVLLFASEDSLRLLDSADTWFMDGTHTTSPTQFHQLFCIRVPLGESCVSVAYALLPSKQQEVYEECLTALLDTCLQRDIRPNPQRIVADYEMAIHNALKSVISANVNIQGCFYHLTQSTWRHVQSEGLQEIYKADEDARNFCWMLDGLAFLPVDRVKDGMAMLKEIVPDNLQGLVDYFDTTYVSGSFRAITAQNGRIRFRRTSPRYEIPTWNVHQATMNDQHRTNNFCESWNNGFRHLVGHKNPSMWNIIKCLMKDASLVEADILRTFRGQPSKKRKRLQTVKHQERLKTLCQQFVSGDKTLEKVVYAMGLCVRIK